MITMYKKHGFAMIYTPRLTMICIGLMIGLLGACSAQNDSESNKTSKAKDARAFISFNKHIRPILNKNCTGCHGGVTKQGGISYIYRGEALGRGNSGRLNIVPGNAKGSELFQRITSNDPSRRMPYKKPALKEGEIALLKQWINEGAQWEDHWSFVRPAQPNPPAKNAWTKNTIDQFAFKQMQVHGLEPEPQANPEQWLRRVSLDLTGLQPSVDELSSFLDAIASGSSESVYEKYVDRLLASPRFGERWASVWMDLARYADSKGYEKDRHREMWPYRDWLINAYNNNMPYDQFVIKQLAGDLLENATLDDYIATVFNRLTSTNDEGGTDDEEYRMLAVMDRSATVWSVLNGLTMNCVQCHSHPYDPIPHADYFHALSFFNTSLDADKLDDTPALKVADDRAVNQQLFIKQTEIFQHEQLLVDISNKVDKKTVWMALNVKSGQVNFNTASAYSANVKSLEWAARPEQERSQIEWCHQREMAIKNKQPVTPIANNKITESYCHSEFWNTKWWYLGYLSALEENKKNRVSPKAHKDLVVKDGQFSEDQPKLPPTGDYQFETKAMQAPINIGMLKLTAKPFDRDKAKHTPQDGFNIDRIGVEIVRADGSIETATIKGFLPLTKQGLSLLTRTLAARKNANINLSSEWSPGFVAHRIFHPVETIAIFEETLQLASGDSLRVSLAQLQMGQLRDGKPYYLRNLSLAYTSALTQDFNDYEYHRHKVVSSIAEVAEVESIDVPVMREQFAHERRLTPIFDRGNYLHKSGEDRLPNTPESLPPLSVADSQRATRLDLAKWFFIDEQPLTARVAANRLWEQMFGRGLVSSMEDFGGAGGLPSHPQLLDWLAVTFQKDLNWDIKALLKLIAMSATYRQNAYVGEEKMAADSSNQWFARGPRQRLTAEMVRDQALLAAGLLSDKMGGESVMPPQPKGVWQQVGRTKKWETPEGDNRYRRAIYTYIKRSAPYPSFQIFDDVGHLVTAARRVPTNTPLQALVTLNDPVYFEAASELGKILLNVAEKTNRSEAFNVGFKRILSRPATVAEHSALNKAFNTASSIHSSSAHNVWIDIAVVMLNMHASLVR